MNYQVFLFGVNQIVTLTHEQFMRVGGSNGCCFRGMTSEPAMLESTFNSLLRK